VALGQHTRGVPTWLSAVWTRRALLEKLASYLNSMGSSELCVDQESFTVYLRRKRATVYLNSMGSVSAVWTRRSLHEEGASYSLSEFYGKC